MGASGSVQSNPDNTIYISYDNNCDPEYKDLCIEKLTTKGYTILSNNKNYIIGAKYVFIFISGHTIKSALQSRDINICFENNKPIIYLITDRDYLPSINASIYNFISGNSYYPFYDKDTVINTINEFNFM
jgi:hypothetical protein